MKYFFSTLLLFIFLYSCRKESPDQAITNIDYLHKVQHLLQDSLFTDDYSSLDFTKVVLTRIDTDAVLFWRVPYKNKSIATDFVLLQTDKQGNYRKGKIINIQSVAFGDQIHNNSYSYNGKISVSTLNRKLVIHSPIINGYITAYQKNSANQKKAPIVPSESPSGWLPEVVIISSSGGGGGSSFSSWYSLQGLLSAGGGGGGGSSSSYYSTSEPGYASHHGGSSGGGSGNGSKPSGGNQSRPIVMEDEAIEVEFDNLADAPFISATKIFKCFDAVSSAGASYSITLCADVPVNAYPTMAVNSGSSVGHAFLVVTKQNGSQKVTQAFGFYPAQTPSLLSPLSPLAGGIKDNGGQEINASIEMSIHEAQFSAIKQKAISWSERKYRLAEYNCSNYAIDIFNSVRPQPLYIAPLSMAASGNTNAYSPTAPITIEINKSPQMLFARLQQIKKEGGAEASRILINQSHNYRSPISKGECN